MTLSLSSRPCGSSGFAVNSKKLLYPPLARSLPMSAQARVWSSVLLMVWALSHASVFGETGEPAPKEPSPAERIKRVLDQPLTLDYSGVPLPEMVRQLKEKTRVNWVLDLYALQQLGLGADENKLISLAVSL